MKMKKIITAAALLAVFTGSEINASAAKTTKHTVAKITRVKVTKHKVTGYTTPKSHLTLMKLKHGETASATANRNGKFSINVKKNNLTKLRFKLKVTKAGMKARTFTYKAKKTGSTNNNQFPTTTHPSQDKPQTSNKPSKDESTASHGSTLNNQQPSSQGTPSSTQPTQKDIQRLKEELEKAKREYIAMQIETQDTTDLFKKDLNDSRTLSVTVNTAREQLVYAQKTNESKEDVAKANDAFETAKSKYDTFVSSEEYMKHIQDYKQASQKLDQKQNQVFHLADQLYKLQPDKPFEGLV